METRGKFVLEDNSPGLPGLDSRQKSCFRGVRGRGGAPGAGSRGASGGKSGRIREYPERRLGHRQTQVMPGRPRCPGSLGTDTSSREAERVGRTAERIVVGHCSAGRALALALAPGSSVRVQFPGQHWRRGWDSARRTGFQVTVLWCEGTTSGTRSPERRATGRLGFGVSQEFKSSVCCWLTGCVILGQLLSLSETQSLPLSVGITERRRTAGKSTWRRLAW